jgi:hypothetical protein
LRFDCTHVGSADSALVSEEVMEDSSEEGLGAKGE